MSSISEDSILLTLGSHGLNTSPRICDSNSGLLRFVGLDEAVVVGGELLNQRVELACR